MKKTVRDLYLLTALALATAGLVAQDTDEPAAPPQQPAQSPAQQPARPGSGDEATEEPAGDVDDVFIPTEEILADEEVTFPVDI
jgi:hypothetical protein